MEISQVRKKSVYRNYHRLYIYLKLIIIYLRFSGSLSDFEPAKHAVPTEQLAEIDRYMLGKLTETVKEAKPCLNIIPFIFH